MNLTPKSVAAFRIVSQDVAQIVKWVAPLRKKVIVSFPKFEMSSEFRLDEALKAIEMPHAFSLPPDAVSNRTTRPINVTVPGAGGDVWLKG